MPYLLLFGSAFLSATLLPMQSEAVLLGLLSQHYSAIGLIFVATLGNVLGSCVNWYLGIHLHRVRHHRYFPFNEQQMQRAEHFYQRYGHFSLWLSWVPIIGDPLTLIAGVLKEPFWRFLCVVSLAKFGRYLVVYAIFLGILNV